MMYVGIDPGKTGAIAWLTFEHDLNRYVMRARKMPASLNGLVEFCSMFIPHRPTIMIENVHAMPRQGVVSTFTFGRGFGQIEGVLTALGLSFSTVEPAIWQERIGGLVAGDKDELHTRANHMFPDMKIPKYQADAILICQYCFLERD